MTPPVKPDLSATLIAQKVEENLRKNPLRESVGTQKQDSAWREHIRFAVTPLLVLGLAFMGKEAWEILTCPRQETCHVHASTMAWGIGLFLLALLIWQRGNVSSSIKEAVEAGADIRARWFTRPGRETDRVGTTVTTVVKEPAKQPPPDPQG